MTLGELIYQYRLDHRLSQRAFAAKCGVSNVYINMLEKNLNPSTGKPIVPTMVQLKAIAEAMGYTLNEITRYLDPESEVTISSDDVPLKTKNDKVRPLTSAESKREAKRKISPRQLESLRNPHSEKLEIDVDLTITVKDDSMYPTYLKNDILYIKSQDWLGFDGQVMAVLLDATTTLVRHVYKDPRGEGFVLIGDNPAYPQEYKTFKDYPDLRLVGWVCGYTRLYDYEKWYKRE